MSLKEWVVKQEIAYIRYVAQITEEQLLEQQGYLRCLTDLWEMFMFDPETIEKFIKDRELYIVNSTMPVGHTNGYLRALHDISQFIDFDPERKFVPLHERTSRETTYEIHEGV